MKEIIPLLEPSANYRLSEKELNDPYVILAAFVNGQTLEELRTELASLRLTTITEGYGNLDKEAKWLTVEYLDRLEKLVEVVFLLHNTRQDALINQGSSY